MGVGKGGGSMSTTADVIYTHKKFKRAATESWESKETRKATEEKKTEIQLPETKLFPSTLQKQSDFKNDKINLSHDNIIVNGHFNEKLDILKDEKRLKCEHCGIAFENQRTYNDHHCIQSCAVCCQNCKEVFQSNHEFSRHQCTLNLAYNETRERGGGQIQQNILDNDASSPKNENALKLAYNRSYSFPGHNYYKHEGSCVDKVSTSPVSAGKQIYKPKFRAQYSFQENSPNQSNVPRSDNSYSSSNNIESPSLSSSEFITYHSTTASLLKPGSSQLNINQGRSNTTTDSLNTKNEEYSISKGFASQCSNIWKGIKSPSPELVGQHITNLIVQNQAIVETHNPLWSMKYRRHSSSASSQVDVDGGTSQKARKVNDNLKTSKAQQSNIYPSSSLDGSTGIQGDSIVTSLCSLPRSYSSYSQSSSAIRASKNISNPSLITSSHQKLKPNSYNYNIHPVHSIQCDYVNISNINKPVVPVNDIASESLDLSKSSKCGAEALVMCNKCGTLLRPSELDHHSRLCYHQIYSHEKRSDNKPEEQEVALDLKKKRDRSCLDDEILRMSTISEPLAKPLQLGETTVISVSPKSLQSSPPLKKKKISSDTYNYEKSSYAHIYPQNGRMSSKTDYGMKFFDDFGKPKVNSHHLYGGEVQICDGKEMKTLKIDSNKSETPSLDLCIASKHLGVDLDSNEAKVPTSVVVTIAKCGLNSGGTMVKIENKSSSSYTTRKIGLNVQNVHGSSSLTQPLPHQEQMISLGSQSTRGMTSPVIHSPLIHYQKSEPSENIANLSFKLLKGVEPNVSVLSNAQSPQSNTVYKTISSHNLLKVNNNNTNTTNNNNSPGLSKVQESDIYKLKPYYPSVISIGDEVIPYVPGIPGPYSQANIILKTPKVRDSPISPVINTVSVPPLKFNKSSSHSPTFSECSVSPIATNTSSNSSCSSRVQNVEHALSKEYAIGSLCPPKLSVKSHPVTHGVVRIPEIRVNSASFETVGTPKSIIEEKIMKNNFESEHKEILSDGNTFLVPRKRPNTLVLKPQAFSLKSSISLIGSTLVSPDTPRPKKSCAQLFLNGSAYTYLNLKVSTKTFFCCIYRPQPMYVLQSTDPKLSMYSNWQIRKTEDPLNISPSEAMSLHVSGLYYNKAYTIAKPKCLELTITDSSYWTQKDRKSNRVTMENIKDDGPSFVKKDKSINPEAKLEFKSLKPKEVSNKTDPEPKRIKICEGGFKTNEDYTYVRGRGRGRYVCETCGIRCKKPSMLKKHIRTHTDLRPFACQHCSFSFKTKGNLTKHLKSKAHFKRCTEMGIIPVPVTANDSHVSAGHIEVTVNMQGLSDQTKDLSQNMYEDEDDDDDEEDDDDDDDEDDEEEDYDEDDDDEPSYTSHREEAKHMKMSEPFVLNQDNRAFISSTLYHPSISLEEKPAHVSSTYSHSEFSRDSDPYPEMDLSTSSKPDRNDDTTPIDLSIKRPSVITACNYQDSTSERDQTVRPSHLPIPKKIATEISKPKSPTAPTTPIRENAKDILSPVTESSLLLKSIYDTTYRVSSSNFEKNSQADPMKDTSCGPMLQTYLTERAVLDSTRKRYQYLHTSVEDQSPSSDQNYSIVYSSHQYSGSSAGTKSYTSSASYHSTSQTLVVSSAAGTGCLVPITSSSYEPGPCYAVVSSSTSVSSSDKLVNVSHSVATSQASVSQASKSFSTIPISQKSESQIVSSSSVVTAITTSSKTSDARINRAGRKSGKAGSGSSLFNTSSPMPTSPANLTVINNCSGDTKTAAFIAPSGVMPSSHNNKLGSDDGKCKCNVCHKEFAKQGQLRLHINIHYIERPHRCESCGISFRTNGHLQKHKRSVSHFNKVNMNMTFGTPSTDNPRPFKCHDCKIAFRIYGHLAKHLRSKLHIMKLECLGKLPFGTYAEIERSGGNLNEIDTSDCENSLESLQLMASKLYEKEPAKLLAWQSQQQQAQQQKLGTERERTISNSSNNSEEYSLIDDQECGTPSSASTGKSNGEESGDEDDPPEVKTSDAPSISPSNSSFSPNVPPCEIGSGATEGLIGCPKCHKKFLDLKAYEVHHLNEHEKLNSNEVDDENVRSKFNESQGSPNTSSSPGIVGIEGSSRSPLPNQQGNSGTTMIDSHQEEDCQL